VITDLPLPIDGGRMLESFAYALTPGVEGNAWTSYISGGIAFSKEVLIDGTSAIVQIGGDIEASSPSLEAVEQFKIETSGVPAEYGRTGGGVFLYGLKSGANQLHGSAVGFMRNEAFNANTWNNNFLAASDPAHAANYKRPLDRQWTYAFSAGGPIIKNKTFIFGAFERFWQKRLALGGMGSTVPLPAFLDGDFSALLKRNEAPLGKDSAGNDIYPGAIIDPQTGIVFPNNVIPPDRLSAVSKKIADIYRQDYQPAVSGQLINNNALPAYNGTWSQNTQFSVKADHSFSDSNKLSSSFIITDLPRILVDSGGIWDPKDASHTGGPLSRSRTQETTSRSFRLSDTHAFTTTLLNTFSFTYGYYRNPSVASSSGGKWEEKLGLGNSVGNFPEINFGSAVNGVETTGIGYGISGFYLSNVYILDNTVTWVKGRHTAKFGFDGRLMQMNSHSPAQPSLRVSFNNNQTGAPTQDWANQVGFGFASFMLGAVETASRDVPIDLYGRRKYVAAFAQDDFKVTDRLTLNLGLRWEATTPLTEKYGNWANFEYNLTNTALGIPGALAFAGNGHTSFMKQRDWKEFSPRLGLAYRVTPKAVIRAAYGILYAPIGLNFWSGVPYGFSPGSKGTNLVAKTANGSPAFNWDSGYPGTLAPGNNDPNLVPYGPVRIDPKSLYAGYIQQWNAGAEFEIAKDLRLGVTYLGNKGSRLQSDQFERNQPDPQAFTALVKSGHEWDWVWDAGSAAAAGVPFPYAGFSNYAWDAIMPYPQIGATWGPLFVLGVPKGSSDYHSLQVTLSRRAARGFTTEMGYTLSRSRGNAANAFEENWWNGDIQDVTKLNWEAKQLLGIDSTHTFKGYVAYELPFGKGRPLLNGASKTLNALVGGWNLAGIFRYQSGLPLTIYSSNYYYPDWSAFIYPNVASNANLSRIFNDSKFSAANQAAPANRYFDPSAFSNPQWGEFGNSLPRRSALRGFGTLNENVSILKNFTVREKYRLQLRAEFTNLFNRHAFDNPVTNMGSDLFGQVTSASGAPRQGQLGLRLDF
jgi:hypothetical protein